MAARVASAGLAAVAVWLAASALLPKAPDRGVPTLVAAHDLPIGATLTAADVRVEQRPTAYLPQGALSEPSTAVGQVMGGPILAGEAVTPVRFRGPGELRALPPGAVAVSVPLSDRGLVATLRPADVVSVLVTGSGETIAASATVLSTDAPADGMLAASGNAGAHVVLAVQPTEARAVAAAMGVSTGGGFVLALHR